MAGEESIWVGDSLTRDDDDVLRGVFTEFGLTGHEARVLVGLLQTGSATAAQLARFADIPRQNVYRVLQSLNDKRLAEQLVGEQMLWASPGREAVVGLLLGREEERHGKLRSRAEEAREILAEMVPENPATMLPFVHIIGRAVETRHTFDELLAGTQFELLMFTRPPFAGVAQEPNPVVMDALARGVQMRVLYQASHLAAPSLRHVLRNFDAYHEAGVEGRVVDDLPVKLMVFDRSVAQLGMTSPATPDEGFPTFLLLEHPGCARLLAAAFEQMWATSRPYPNTRKAVVLAKSKER